MKSSADENGIRAAINYYIEGMRTGNVEVLRQGFHQQAILCGYLGDEMIAAPIEGLYDWVKVKSRACYNRRSFRLRSLVI